MAPKTVSALVLLSPQGTEEIEFVTVYDVLVRAGAKVQSLLIQDPASQTQAQIATCSRHVRIVPDQILDTGPAASHRLPSSRVAELVDEYDIVILPGGAPCAALFASHPAVHQIVAGFLSRPADRWVAAICASTAALVAAVDGAVREGDLVRPKGADSITVVGHPSVRDRVVGRREWSWIDDEFAYVHVHERIITSRGPGTALLWSLAIIEALLGVQARDAVAEPMIVP